MKFINNPWKDKMALITGASAGIGSATARKLAAEGLTVLLVARRLDRLEALQKEIKGIGGKAFCFAVDLTQPEERKCLYDAVCRQFGGVDVLVNNAGLGYYGYTAEMPWQTAEAMMEVNIAALVQLTLLFLPVMEKRRTGHIVNIGSIAGKMPNQGVAMYSASKAFVDSFTTSVFRELKGTGVHMSVLRPGPVTTEFYDAAQRISAGSRRTPGEGGAVPAERVAKAVWSLIRHPRKVAYVPGILSISPWMEILFGWLIDQLGPLLLKRKQAIAVALPVSIKRK
jgi:uncharacterized protein